MAGEPSHTEVVRPVIFLFDIDGTLIDAAGAGRRALTAAFDARFERGDVLAGITFCGRTDRGLVREALRLAGEPEDLAVVDAILADYIARLPGELASTAGYCVYDGVGEALSVASAVGMVGLGTGNIAAGARLKLDPFGLTSQFSFGGYGCDAEDRAALLRIGARRGAAQAGCDVEDCCVRVIGDTPLDIAAAHAIGASCLAVTTGRYDRAALARHEPTCIVEDLSRPAALEFLMAPATTVDHR